MISIVLHTAHKSWTYRSSPYSPRQIWILTINVMYPDVEAGNTRVERFDRCEDVANFGPASIRANNKIEVLLSSVSEVK